ncbi:MAG: 50S ribosomal protein L9 [Polyangia bacterium]|jgi:large subunit ribosomal protein L9|nr:50S ribosomal protein L9 [Polyangia bacterium]
MPIQVILKEDVPNLGTMGQLVSVKPGYGRNYLIPRGLAVEATSRNIKNLEHQRQIIERQREKMLAEARNLGERLKETSVTISKNTSDEDRLYGSVTNREIADALAAEGLKVDRRKIEMQEPIRSLGVFTVKVRLSSELTGELKVWVVKAE